MPITDETMTVIEGGLFTWITVVSCLGKMFVSNVTLQILCVEEVGSDPLQCTKRGLFMFLRNMQIPVLDKCLGAGAWLRQRGGGGLGNDCVLYRAAGGTEKAPSYCVRHTPTHIRSNTGLTLLVPNWATNGNDQTMWKHVETPFDFLRFGRHGRALFRIGKSCANKFSHSKQRPLFVSVIHHQQIMGRVVFVIP